jgi:hypothetical protein
LNQFSAQKLIEKQTKLNQIKTEDKVKNKNDSKIKKELKSSAKDIKNKSIEKLEKRIKNKFKKNSDNNHELNSDSNEDSTELESNTNKRKSFDEMIAGEEVFETVVKKVRVAHQSTASVVLFSI